MHILTDSEGFLLPVVFVVASFLILLIFHKKHKNLLWLSILPLIGLVFYQGHIEDVRLQREQKEFAETSWSRMYQPLFVDATMDESNESDGYDAWRITTENGEYKIRFNTEETEGYEVTETIWETESLRGRKNVLDVLDLLELEGHLEYIEKQTYVLIGTDNEYTIKLNENDRIQEITDDNNGSIYTNEEASNKSDGRTLREEETSN